MKKSLLAEFAGRKPKAIVLDDHAGSRAMTARKLRQQGFDVRECASVEEFNTVWSPGMFDVIVADWQLSSARSDHGDKVLSKVRKKDWDVPFVLVSGKLGDDDRRVKVLQTLLDEGSARFVRRGSGGITKVCEEATALLERRDSTLLKVILALRDAAEQGEGYRTSAGYRAVKDQLAELVARPDLSHNTVRPLASVRSEQIMDDR